MALLKLQRYLGEVTYLDPFWAGFRPRYGASIVLITLMDDLCQEQDGGYEYLLAPLPLLVGFYITNLD